MAMIRCKACGKLYSYEKEGCCPGCGAYNRPPKRERVNPDGTVQHMTDAEYARRRKAAGKVCFEEKECYEQKVCYEDQARRGKRSASSAHADRRETVHAHDAAGSVSGTGHTAAADLLRQMTAARSGSRGKNKARTLPRLIIAIIIIISMTSGILETVFNRISDKLPWNDDPAAHVPVEDPAEYYDYDAAMGETLTMADGTTFTVDGWTVDDAGKTVSVSSTVAFADSDHSFYPSLLCTDADGDEVTLDYKEARGTSAKPLLIFNAADYKKIQPFCLIMEERDGNDEPLGTWLIDLR